MDRTRPCHVRTLESILPIRYIICGTGLQIAENNGIKCCMLLYGTDRCENSISVLNEDGIVIRLTAFYYIIVYVLRFYLI